MAELLIPFLVEIYVCYQALLEIASNGLGGTKKRPVIEQTINHLKNNICVAGIKSRNLSTAKAYFLLYHNYDKK